MPVARIICALSFGLALASCSQAGKSPAVAVPGAKPGRLMAHPGGCRDCHSDMGTTLPTRPPPADVCSQCHDALAEHAEKLHAPFILGDCGTCHVPHASSFRALGRRPEPQLCSHCHAEEFVCSPAREVLSHGEAGPSRCTECHAPHAGSKPYLLWETERGSLSAIRWGRPFEDGATTGR